MRKDVNNVIRSNLKIELTMFLQLLLIYIEKKLPKLTAENVLFHKSERLFLVVQHLVWSMYVGKFKGVFQ